MPFSGIIQTGNILRQINLLRLITAGFMLSMMLLAVFILDIALPRLPMAFALVVMGGFILYTHHLVNHSVEAGSHRLFVQIVFDISVLTLVLYYSGGATSPFTFLYLIPLAIAATVIPGRLTWVLTLLTVVFYTLLLKYYVPLNYLVHDHENMHGNDQFNQHVFGMWFGFLLSALLVSWFISHMARALRRRDQAIADARQRELRDQQLIALGTLAAGTAHELGTPLGSLSILVNESTEGIDPGQHAELFRNQEIMRKQIQRCKAILQRLSNSAEQLQASEGEALDANQFIERVIALWQPAGDRQQYRMQLDSGLEGVCLLFDQSIAQAIVNLLNNAMEVSSEPIDIRAWIEEDQLILDILDNGHGMSHEEINMAGKVCFSNKPGGMGIGLYIAITTLKRIGTDVIFSRRPESGTCTRVKLALLEI